MHSNSKITVSPEVIFQQVEDEFVLLDLKRAEYFGLDAVGGRVFALIHEHGDLDQVMATMLAEYDVAPARLRADLERLLGELQAKGLVTLTPCASGSDATGP